MADATVTNLRQNVVVGNRVMINADTITFAANGDTWDTGLNSINVITLTPTTEEAYGLTVSGGVITVVDTNAPVTFRGGAIGNF
jgi:hypothetical protein